ncbi:glycosyltransferase family 2 protein [Bacillus sp. FDAARGOS_1420]|uniref:glycosyltransferase family 2 protein n=1 Tax=unclassified Bacillus (in: firmicutes) TaxID=185979 RepID=UPI001C5BFBC6|nr:glycosyltransferase family 2 protein [Bacillus sp. FDAARGOS_1420]MBW3493262.1 glycosyltransferase family 2 protein [Bacillus sp. FDAARGOS_1420]
MLTSIIILTHNQLQYTKECIHSIRKYTVQEEYELIVVDNASMDGTVEWLQKQPDITLIKNLENMGFPRGCNQGISTAKGENILLLNNDVIVTEQWLTNLLKCLYAKENTAAVGPVTNNASYYSTIHTCYGGIQEMQEFASLYNQSDENKWEERMKLIGFCMLIKKTVLDEIGLLDERFTPGNYEDDDLSLRMFEKGYKLYLCRDTFIHHYGSMSWKEDVSKFSMILNENDRKFYDKWGFSSADLYIQYDLLEVADRYEVDKVNILQVGAGCGATLLEMKRRYAVADVYGVESNQQAASISNRVAPTACIQYDNLQEVFPGKRFHIILLSHPIEKEQLSGVINSISHRLASKGTVIMSSANLINYTALQNQLTSYEKIE